MYYCEYCAKEMLMPLVVWSDEHVFCCIECEKSWLLSLARTPAGRELVNEMFSVVNDEVIL
jgi:hypothetical protein